MRLSEERTNGELCLACVPCRSAGSSPSRSAQRAPPRSCFGAASSTPNPARHAPRLRPTVGQASAMPAHGLSPARSPPGIGGFWPTSHPANGRTGQTADVDAGPGRRRREVSSGLPCAPAGTCHARQSAAHGDGCLDGDSLAALAASGRLSVGAQTPQPRHHLVNQAFND